MENKQEQGVWEKILASDKLPHSLGEIKIKEPEFYFYATKERMIRFRKELSRLCQSKME